MKMCSTGSHVWTVSWGRWCCWEVNELLELWTSLKEERDGGGALSEFTHLPHFQVTLFLYVELKCDLFPLLLPACLSRWTASPLQLFLTPLLIKEFYRSSRRVIDTQPLRVTRPGHEQLHGLPHHKNNHERPGRPLSLYLLKIAYTLLGYITQVWKKRWLLVLTLLSRTEHIKDAFGLINLYWAPTGGMNWGAIIYAGRKVAR